MAEVPRKVVDVRSASAESGVLEDLLVERHVRRDALHDDLRQRIAHARDRRIPILAMSDDLRDQRIVVRRDVVTRIEVTIDTNSGPSRRMPELHRPR
jgi:hypothetical protein